MAGSRFGRSPKLQSRLPPYFLGMLSLSRNFSSVAAVSLSERIKILDCVASQDRG
jgi:hypothetical protein